MKYTIEHNKTQLRFETNVDQSLCVIDYELQATTHTVALTHVIVPSAVEGRGIAGQLTQAALDWARAESYRVNPVCPYVQTWLRRHPEYMDLVEA
jgi:uncharacterized protein